MGQPIELQYTCRGGNGIRPGSFGDHIDYSALQNSFSLFDGQVRSSVFRREIPLCESCVCGVSDGYMCCTSWLEQNSLSLLLGSDVRLVF